MRYMRISQISSFAKPRNSLISPMASTINQWRATRFYSSYSIQVSCILLHELLIVQSQNLRQSSKHWLFHHAVDQLFDAVVNMVSNPEVHYKYYHYEPSLAAACIFAVL